MDSGFIKVRYIKSINAIIINAQFECHHLHRHLKGMFRCQRRLSQLSVIDRILALLQFPHLKREPLIVWRICAIHVHK